MHVVHLCYVKSVEGTANILVMSSYWPFGLTGCLSVGQVLEKPIDFCQLASIASHFFSALLCGQPYMPCNNLFSLFAQ
uniref:Uncharacterized protein n=1 Tax=Aegilops tauschii subsp. strangulata TaxID=200361 RepID=A0A453KDK4_AEGTS